MSTADEGRTATLRADRGRFGQLTYTSVEGESLGGWQVKDVTGLSHEEQEMLRSRIDPVLETDDDLPRFPSPHEVASLPRRLVFSTVPLGGLLDRFGAPVPQGQTEGLAWWHHAPAGLDGSGRPGNVFTHVVLDRDPLAREKEGQFARPVDRWRSAGWLTPYGAEAVRESTLPAVPPPANGRGIPEVISFLLDPNHYRLGVLAVLMDACAAALSVGRPIALATRDTDQAASWIAAVSQLMAVTTARRLSFSTLERGVSIHNRVREGVLFCCFPSRDYDHVRESKPDGLVLLAEDDDLDLGDLDGEPHVTAAGDEVTVTEWSLLARVGLVDRETAEQTLYALDQLSARLRLDNELDSLANEPGWPLALVVASRPDSLSDALVEASRVLLRRDVRSLQDDGELQQSVQSLVDRVSGTSTADVWQALGPLRNGRTPLTSAATALMERYVMAAATDEGWLAQQGGAPLPPPNLVRAWRPSPRCAGTVRQAVVELGSRSTDDVHAALNLLRLANFLAHLQLIDRKLSEVLETELERGVVHRLLSDDAGTSAAVAFAAGAGRVAEPVLALLRPLVNDKLNEIRNLRTRIIFGRFVTAEVLHWLYPEAPAHLLLDQVTSLSALRLRAEIALLLTRENPVANRGERELAVVMALDESWGKRALESLLRGPAWHLTQLEEIEHRYPGDLPLEAFTVPFLTEPNGHLLERLAQELPAGRFSRTTGSPAAEAVLRMRLLGQRRWWRDQHAFRANLGDVMAGGVRAVEQPQVQLSPDVVDQLQGAMMFAAILRSHTAELEQLWASPQLNGPTVRSAVWDMLLDRSEAEVSSARVVLAAVIADPAFPGELATPGEAWAAEMRFADPSTTPAFVLKRYARLRLAKPHQADLLCGRLHNELWRLHSLKGSDEREAKRDRRFVDSWVRSVARGGSVLGRWRGGE